MSQRALHAIADTCMIASEYGSTYTSDLLVHQREICFVEYRIGKVNHHPLEQG